MDALTKDQFMRDVLEQGARARPLVSAGCGGELGLMLKARLWDQNPWIDPEFVGDVVDCVIEAARVLAPETR